MTDDLRLRHIEEALNELKQRAVDRSWFEERLGRTDDQIASYSREAERARLQIVKDIEEIKADERARRRATYTAVVGSLAALLVALIQTVPL